MSTPPAKIAGGWQRFWFTPQPTSTLAVFRIAFGVLATLYTVSLVPDLFAFFSVDGITPEQPSVLGTWGLLELSSSRPVVLALFLVTLAGALALTVGWHTRLAAIVLFLGILSFDRRNPALLNSGDGLFRNLALFLAFAPSGVALSLDRLRTAPGRFWEFPARAPWALRLIQIQMSVLYFSTVWHKVQGVTWRDGTAVSYALRLADLQRFPPPAFITDSVIYTEILTFGTLALELSLAILVWNRAVRPWVLGLGVILHVMIDVSILVGFFSLTVLAAYLTFIPAETTTRHVLALRDRIRRRRGRRGSRIDRLAELVPGPIETPALVEDSPEIARKGSPDPGRIPGVPAAESGSGRHSP